MMFASDSVPSSFASTSGGSASVPAGRHQLVVVQVSQVNPCGLEWAGRRVRMRLRSFIFCFQPPSNKKPRPHQGRGCARGATLCEPPCGGPSQPIRARLHARLNIARPGNGGVSGAAYSGGRQRKVFPPASWRPSFSVQLPGPFTGVASTSLTPGRGSLIARPPATLPVHSH
jgi:hypothetical protein